MDQQLVFVAIDHGAKSIPFRLEDPRVCVGWNFIHSLGEHGEDRRWQGEWHGVLDAGYRLGSFEDEKVVVLVALGEVVLLDEAEAGALDFGDDDVGVDAVVGAVAGVVDDAEEAAGLHRRPEVGEERGRVRDLVVDAGREGGVEGVGGEFGVVLGAQDGGDVGEVLLGGAVRMASTA